MGGGVIGLLSAYELVQAGRSVVVLEQGQVGRESSWAGGGILSPLYPWRYADPVNLLAGLSQQAYPALITSLRKQTGVDPEWVRSGLLILDGSEGARAQAWATTVGERGIVAPAPQIELLKGTQVNELEPALGSVSDQAIWMPQIAQVRNPSLMTALRQWLLGRGVEIREGVQVQGFRQCNGRLVGLKVRGGEIEASHCLLAAGAWSGQLLESVGMSLAVEPVKGQVLLLGARPGQLSRIILHKGRYLIPRRDGRVLVGSTVEYAGFDKTVTQAARDDLHQVAISLVPGLADCPTERQWAGLRPGSPHGVPFIDNHIEIEGLYICTGHYRNGFVLGPASARLVVDLILGRQAQLNPRPYSIKTARAGDAA
ncbi:MAG: glycine oxidase ThiO [Gammaproteobacteria bacterium]|nr:glycine oxidase ThiO [Gammaproteobacteria bacterium]